METLSFFNLIVLLLIPNFESSQISCTDPKYLSYIDQRIEFYEELDKERYDELADQRAAFFSGQMSKTEKERFLFSGVELSARFGSVEEAKSLIDAYKNPIIGWSPFFKTGDKKHKIFISHGWLALRQNDPKLAIQSLLLSAKTETSPVLGSFGPDMTLVRALYKMGYKQAVIDYLSQIRTFWNNDQALRLLAVWDALIKNDCPIQFQYYDIPGAAQLGIFNIEKN